MHFPNLEQSRTPLTCRWLNDFSTAAQPSAPTLAFTNYKPLSATAAVLLLLSYLFLAAATAASAGTGLTPWTDTESRCTSSVISTISSLSLNQVVFVALLLLEHSRLPLFVFGISVAVSELVAHSMSFFYLIPGQLLLPAQRRSWSLTVFFSESKLAADVSPQMER